jgi:leucyl aminopeptidase
MPVHFRDANPLLHATPLLAVPVPEGVTEPAGILADLDEAMGGRVMRAFASGDMKGRSKDEVLLYGPAGGPQRVVLLGAGDEGELDAEAVRRFAGRAVRVAERFGLDGVSIWMNGGAQVEGGEDDPVVQVDQIDLFGEGDPVALAEGARVGAIIAGGENLARNLQSRPGNVATPSHLASEAERIAAELGMAVTVFDEARLREEGMHAILTVSRGSEEEARLIVLEHRGGEEGEAPLILVGKGLTFDAGGISIKPAAGMEDMKFDMSGGAAVIGAMRAVAELAVKANVVGIVPSSENLPSGTAVKPGDVIRTLAGKSVEVINTDAEGRLILADALTYGARLNPAAMVDCATLTGAVVVGLGNQAAAVLGNDEALVEELRGAGTRSGERCWPLPLWDEYGKQLESDTADLKNVGGRAGGTITAAYFLSEFVGEAKWAHLDVAGTAYGDGTLSYHRKGGYGFPARLLVEWVRSRAG